MACTSPTSSTTRHDALSAAMPERTPFNTAVVMLQSSGFKSIPESLMALVVGIQMAFAFPREARAYLNDIVSDNPTVGRDSSLRLAEYLAAALFLEEGGP